MIINDIPSSCRMKNCTYIFDEQITPTLHSVSPIQGQGGTLITLQGSGFSDDMNKVIVVIGSAPCNVTFTSTTTIECVADRHAAGSYNISVHIKGIGWAYNPLSFTYLLTLNSISPDVGGMAGGGVITIVGEGFLNFTNVPVGEFGSNILSNLPWLHYGIGLPTINNFQDLGRFPHSESLTRHKEKLKYLHQHDYPENSQSNCTSNENICHRDLNDIFFGPLLSVFSHFPQSVIIAGAPCVITRSNLHSLSCVTTFNFPVQGNVSVTVFSETATLENAFTISLEHTPVIQSTDPLFGPVTGGTVLTISGSGFNVHNLAHVLPEVKVTVGDSGCVTEISNSTNSTQITCVTDLQAPGAYPIMLLTPSGIAVWEPFLQRLKEEYFNNTQQRNCSEFDIPLPFPTFEYRLLAQTAGPLKVSRTGGTEVIISGGVFVENKTRVYVGDQPAEILSLENDSLVILTPPSVLTERVHLNGGKYTVCQLDNCMFMVIITTYN